MSKYCGRIGYAEDLIETSPGVWESKIIERTYFGDIPKNNQQLENSEINSDVVCNNVISIVADAYAYEHISAMRYITWMKTKWVVSNVAVMRPRLNITLGGVYHGKEPTGTSETSGANIGK